MTEDLLDGSGTEALRPTASLTSSMIKRRRPVRVATPEDASARHADAPVKAARELASRVERAFAEDARQPTSEQPQPSVQAPQGPQASAAGDSDALEARQQELRRLAAERAEAQNRPPKEELRPEQPARPATAPLNAISETSDEARRAETQPPVRQAPPVARGTPSNGAVAAPGGLGDAVSPNGELRNIEVLREGQAPVPGAPGGRRRSLVQGGMTALERRRAALEQHRRLTDAQARRAETQPRDIATYWDELRRGRQVPAMIEMDPHQIARHWPNSLLISCDDLNGAAILERSFAEVMRGAREKAAAGGEIVVEYTPMVTEWIMTVGREVARSGRPVQDIEVFPTSLGNVSYRVIALPLSGERLGTVHALCYIAHA